MRAMRGRSRLERAAAQYTAGAGGAAVGLALARGTGRARAARNGAGAGGLRTTLDAQRTAVAAPRVEADGSTFFSFFSSAVKATLRPSTGPRAPREAAVREHVKNS